MQDTGSPVAGTPLFRSFYTYDQDGRLARDVRENLNMRWTMDNKIRQVQKESLMIRYLYDAAVNRVMKRIPAETTEYILRDGTGNELERITIKGNTTVRTEGSIYGSSRLGTLSYPTTTTPDTVETRPTGRCAYEIVDHLGNVRATISDVKTIAASTGGYTLSARVLSANDYFPFGLPSRTFQPSYKWGFNGKENDREVLTGGRFQDYGFRAYRPDLGRFFAVDPLKGKYPYYSTYQFAGNIPIRFIDLDGLEPGEPFGTKEDAALNFQSIYGRMSIQENREFSTAIYQDKHSNYRYMVPRPGGPISSPTIYPTKKEGTFEGGLHSHAADDPEYDGNTPSDQDKFTSYNNQKEEYISTTNGSLLKFIPPEFKKNLKDEDQGKVEFIKKDEKSRPGFYDKNDQTVLPNQDKSKEIDRSSYSKKELNEIKKENEQKRDNLKKEYKERTKDF